MIITHSDITGQIVQYFKKNIEAGEWKVGEKIPSENQLTQKLGVSRASVRTAIQQMVGIGVLESVHGKGTFLIDDQVDGESGENRITAEDCKDIEKVLEFRRIVESEACYMATKNQTPELIEALRSHLDYMIKNKGEKEQFVLADISFHQTICQASNNLLLYKSMNKIFEENRKNHQQMNDIFGYRDGIYYHTIILNAIQEGDADKARECMFEHMQNGIQRLQADLPKN
ncbi:GntR family transcriptional repressor for pyruvate dehydrogenase complex [Aequitasia blattaphilus]|uniref:FadR family transcriptional regulator n=1 Tax=Aequitasia blattaphilus TaxID=2949332 RepID=A0ABT1EE92_9FIRM|nr:FadR/GntR family transcriptional regulator [Aequitasia blattaphilus]MCP1102787.1 FadR family transcriptional regulator [Aequitasia blattaphilus]MCR8615427.1 FadR family transcriptional regulator [Aequitasia blattaphilus]